MRIILKEDNIIHAEYIKDLLINVQIKLNLYFDITITNDCNEILNYNKHNFEIVNILDIMNDDTHEETGIKVAAKIREYNSNAYIIFLSAFDNYIREAVNKHIEPLAYISKADKNIQEKLESVFKRITVKENRFNQDLKIKFTDEHSDTIFLYANDIYMIHSHTSRQKYIQVETSTNTYTCRGKLTDFEYIASNLVKCHKSFIVNKSKIFKIKKGRTPKSKLIEFDNDLQREFPECILSDTFKNNIE